MVFGAMKISLANSSVYYVIYIKASEKTKPEIIYEKQVFLRKSILQKLRIFTNNFFQDGHLCIDFHVLCVSLMQFPKIVFLTSL